MLVDIDIARARKIALVMSNARRGSLTAPRLSRTVRF
jgi:hypothetical protein